VEEQGTSPLVWVGAVVAALFLLLVAVLGGVRATAQADGTTTLGRLALWLPLVTTDAGAAGLPPVLELGLIGQESGGDYEATTDDANGTVDAGLGQINSGPQPADAHWAALGLLADPYDPLKNVAASVQTLAADIQGNGGQVAAGLYAYNGGSAANGRAFDPQYVPDVMGFVGAMESVPVLAVWPAGGGLSGGVWSTGPSAGPGMAFFVVTAMAPAGRPFQWAGMQWWPMVPPLTLSATVGGLAVGMEQSGVAPSALLGLMPPASTFWWFSAPVGAAPVHVAVRATWTGVAQQQGSTTVQTASITVKAG